MCGIIGAIQSSGLERPEDLSASLKSLSHRGPDDEGLYRDAHCVLGHRRLSIIDLTTGHQPIGNEDGSLWVICNGEIYNYRELAADLRAAGHIFSTRSDSEVILHLYEQYGPSCVERLNGIFAFAIWDKNKKEVFVARDHLGVKPLFYYTGQKFLFASEIKALLAMPDVERTLNLQALYHYFSLNYTPSPLTMFKDIHALPAGHYLIFSSGRLDVRRYWDVDFQAQEGRDAEDLAGELRRNLENSVKAQLVSDVPVGAFLSGGLDSSAIIHFIRKNNPASLKTFNVRFAEGSYDESAYARQVARAYGTDHHEIFCQASDYLKYIDDIIWHADNLTTDISMLPLYLVSKLAREHVKVVLSGDGADELFAGYPTYAADRWARFYRRLPGFLKEGLIPGCINRLPTSDKKMSFEFKARRFVYGARLSAERAHYSWRIIFNEAEKRALLKETLLNQPDSFWAYERFYHTLSWDDLSRHQYADLKVWLVDSILAKVDLMSMAHALEVRVPFLNPRLVEFAARIPSRYRLRGKTPKYILKKALACRLPPAVLKRSKAGFNIPIGRWLRGELKNFMTDVLSPGALRRVGHLNEVYVGGLVEEHLAGRRDHGYQLLSLLHFCLWHEKFINAGQPAGGGGR